MSKGEPKGDLDLTVRCERRCETMTLDYCLREHVEYNSLPGNIGPCTKCPIGTRRRLWFHKGFFRRTRGECP